MIDWQIGDLAVCINDDPCPYYGPSPYRKGQVYTVTAVVLSKRGQVGLSFAEIVIHSETGAAYHGDFRKVQHDKREACESEFVTLLNRKRVSA